jgi:hypothetical protein
MSYTYFNLRLEEQQKRNRRTLYQGLILMVAFFALLGMCGNEDRKIYETSQRERLTHFVEPMTALEVKHLLNAPKTVAITEGER